MARKFPNKLKAASLAVVIGQNSDTPASINESDFTDILHMTYDEFAEGQRQTHGKQPHETAIAIGEFPGPDFDSIRRQLDIENKMQVAVDVSAVVAHVFAAAIELPPDRLSSDTASPFHDKDMCARIGVRFNGVERNADVREYCVSAGWARIEVRKNGRGKFLTTKLYGKVEPYFK